MWSYPRQTKDTVCQFGDTPAVPEATHRLGLLLWPIPLGSLTTCSPSCGGWLPESSLVFYQPKGRGREEGLVSCCRPVLYTDRDVRRGAGGFGTVPNMHIKHFYVVPLEVVVDFRDSHD